MCYAHLTRKSPFFKKTENILFVQNVEFFILEDCNIYNPKYLSHFYGIYRIFYKFYLIFINVVYELNLRY